MTATHREEEPYVQLREGPRQWLTSTACWPVASKFEQRCKTWKLPIHNLRHRLNDLKNHRHAVPLSFAQFFERYLNYVYKEAWPYKTSVEMWEPGLAPEKLAEAEGAWFNWDTVRDALLGRFQASEEMYVCDPEREIPVIAEIVVRRVGELISIPTEPRDAASSLERGQKWMQRTVKEYSDWLLAKHKKDKHSVMYVVHRMVTEQGEFIRRVGVTVAFGITQPTFDALAAGTIIDKEIKADDVQSPSQHVFINALFRNYDADELTVAEYSTVEVNSILIQIAYFVRSIKRFSFITFGGTPKYRERLEAVRKTNHP
jgi:hypothetical protein